MIDSSETIEAEAGAVKAHACAFFATKELPARIKAQLNALPAPDNMTPDQLALIDFLNREVERDVAHEEYCKET